MKKKSKKRGRSKFIYELLWKFNGIFRKINDWGLIKYKVSNKTTSGHILPVNQIIQIGENIVLPLQLIRPLVERADCVAIMNECICRRGEKCKSFPIDFGCLFLGSAAYDLDPELARIVTPEEAIAHTEKAIKMGLVPLIVHDIADARIWGIEYNRMMNICFCCDCCCSIRLNIRKKIPLEYSNFIYRLPGLTVSVSNECSSCGICVDLCFASAIDMRDDGAHITENCKGCGRCVSECPQQAIRMELKSSEDTIQRVLEVYERRTNVGPLSKR